MSHRAVIVNVKAQRIFAEICRTGGGGEQIFDGGFFENTHTVFAFSEIHQHLVEAELIANRRPQSGSGRGENRRAVMGKRHPFVECPELRLFTGSKIVHGDRTGKLFIGGIEGSIFHSQRVKHPFFEELFPGLSGDGFDDRRADIDTGVGIFDRRAGFKKQRNGRGFPGGIPQGKSGLTPFDLGGNLEIEAAGMVHHHADGKHIFCGDNPAFGTNLEIFEFRQIF